MTMRKLAMPWAPSGARNYCLPTSVLLTLALGEAPEHVPALADVRRGLAKAAVGLDGGPLDRVVRRYAGAVRIARVHAARAGLNRPGQRHLGFDTLEQVSGVARSFLLQVMPGTPLGPMLQDLAQLARVTAATPNYVCVSPAASAMAAPQPPTAEQAWAPHLLVRAPEALAYEPGDSAVLLGLVDSGIAADHPELAGRLRAGWDTVDLGDEGVGPGVKLLGEHRRHDQNPQDSFVGHGMGCAGIMSGLGLQLPPGLAGEAQIIPMRALAAALLPGRERAVGLGAISDLDAAVKLAVDLGAKVINMSFGTDDAALAPDSPKPHAAVVDYALQRGCILVAASGNDGHWTKYWPAAHSGVIAVGAVNGDCRVTGFSTRGEHVALCAPGEQVVSAGLQGYQQVTGTSFAAPFVAAACALLVARGARRAAPVDSECARQLLVQSCQPFGGTRESGCGAGVLDAAAALAALDAMIDQAREEEQSGDGE